MGWSITDTICAVKKIRMSRQMDGRSVMVEGSFPGNRKSELIFFHGRWNDSKYTEALSQALLPFINSHNVNVIFQQEKCFHSHTRSYKKRSYENNINVMNWPTRSSDLHPIGNT